MTPATLRPAGRERRLWYRVAHSLARRSQMSRLSIGRVLALVVTALLISISILMPAIVNAQEGTVTVQWLGWSHYRFTSPTGKVLLTNPFVTNPDSPVRAADITKADIIVVADGHGDEVGATIDIAQRTGAIVVAPSFEMGTWFMEMGVPQSQV